MSAASVCDNCHRTVQHPLDWITLSPHGFEARAFGSQPISGDFCSKACVVAHLQPTPENEATTHA